MTLATVHSRAQTGLAAPEVAVEVDLAGGLPALAIVGLPETEVKESKDRVRAAIANSGYEFPTRRITVNLAPADLPKEGGRFDLAIALGILAASGQIPAAALSDYEFLGELSLSGALRSVRGALPATLAASRRSRRLVLPAVNGDEAALAADDAALTAVHLSDVAQSLVGDEVLWRAPEAATVEAGDDRLADIADVRGQPQAKRALEIAAAGGHSLLMIGPPGAGKTMLASRLPGLLPPMTREQALEVAAIASITPNGFQAAQWGRRPFRAPHHTASGVALVGGGSTPKPGEITLAHRGVLFLDELPEFDRKVLEVLREPLESGQIVISRAARQAEFPASFLFVAAMNPCPCGYFGDASGRCHCTHERITRYRSRLSGPLLDRIDMHLHVAPITKKVLMAPAESNERSSTVQARVIGARQSAMVRSGDCNAALTAAAVDQHCVCTPDAERLLSRAIDQLGLSARGYHRILRVARTIADLADAPTIEAAHVAEAIGFRQLERNISTP
ncbi:YifB family Mg chelatase-like AAA ATPase [Salinisphaera sp. Q1T1-3]|uniref:YifB family Mg chelatase-like AAA ATPase n=1 Tax=Salinisphaera sp. Q1T1-3 TaxID=2321229 RepID=UPI000E7196DB|nr:YifB family Mg chelatase-like AAA ATPase [Salinisphaera sp. Q1T1-3]RJS91882.1 ATP-dependent protease [Salinisphaera sp. Q1T1-3]